MPITVRRPRSSEDLEKYYHARWYILRRPWHQPIGSERDELENDSIHLMAIDGKKVVGVARAHINRPGEAQFRYMGVDVRYRRHGIATRLLRALEKEAKKRGAKIAWFNAREPAVPLYEKCGYSIFEESYILFGCIPHWKMMKEL
jgi:ribosomal protein S18 acetylase RimI-like enzyme